MLASSGESDFVKIAVIVESIEAWRGGAETSTLELAELLAGRGHDVHVVTSSRRPSTPVLTIHHLPVSHPLRPLRTGAFLRKAAAFVRAHEFDIVHSIAPLPGADVYQPRGGSLRETLERNVALRATPGRRLFKRATSALNLKYRELLRLERQACGAGGPIIAAVSNYVAEQFRRYYGIGPPRVRVIFNGVRSEPAPPRQREDDRRSLREQYAIGADTLVLLCVAHNFRLKGVPRVIDALARLAARELRDVRAIIIGRDDPVPVQRQAERLGVANRLIFVGSSPRVAAYLHAADVCVHPTYYDPCSRVVLEALAQGVPTITTRQNGAAEIIHDGGSGYVLDSADDVAGLTERIARLADPVARAAMAAEAALLAPRVRMSRHVEELEALFGELRDNRRSTEA